MAIELPSWVQYHTAMTTRLSVSSIALPAALSLSLLALGCGSSSADDPDADLDGVADDVDNCPNFPNPAQDDVDGDEIGDYCDVEVVDIETERLYVPSGAVHVMSGVHCYSDVWIAGSVEVAANDGMMGGALELVAATILLDSGALIDGDASGHPGGGIAMTPNAGGHMGSGPSPGCGGGRGSSVGNGGAGAGNGGAGGQTDYIDNANGVTPCDLCDLPTQAHCHPLAGAELGLPSDESAPVGSGGGAAGNSGGCMDGAPGGSGGASIVLRATSMEILGTVTANGGSPAPIEMPGPMPDCDDPYRPGGGGGAGGSVVLASDDVLFGAGAEISAEGGAGGDSLGATDMDYLETWAWSGGGGGGGRVKIFAAVSSGVPDLTVAAGLGGAIPPIADPDSFEGLPGTDGSTYETATIPPSLSDFACF